MDKVINLLRVIYHRIPSPLQLLFIPIKFLISYISSAKVEAWLLTGKEKNCGEDISLLYSGNEWNKNYFKKLIYGDGETQEQYLGNFWLWQVKNRRKSGISCSIQIVETSLSHKLLINERTTFCIPRLVMSELDIPTNVSSFLDYRLIKSDLLVDNKSLKSDLRRIRNNGLTYKVTDDVAALKSFYETMYVPYINRIHEDRAINMTYDWMLHGFKKWELLLVTKGQEQIGGMFVSYDTKSAYLRFLGVKDGNTQHLRAGVMGALYYFSLCRFVEKGYRKASLGGSRAFLQDGILSYKKKWGSRITREDKTKFIVSVFLIDPGVKSFLINNPLLHKQGHRLIGVLFSDSQKMQSQEAYASKKEKLTYKGISEYKLIKLADGQSDTKGITLVE